MQICTKTQNFMHNNSALILHLCGVQSNRETFSTSNSLIFCPCFPLTSARCVSKMDIFIVVGKQSVFKIVAGSHHHIYVNFPRIKKNYLMEP